MILSETGDSFENWSSETWNTTTSKVSPSFVASFKTTDVPLVAVNSEDVSLTPFKNTSS